MKLQIETWVIEKGYNNNIQKLFNESVICYRNGAYRASFIYSYIGFLTIIKETIVKSNRPLSFNLLEWNKIITNINNDELWEKEVYEALTRTTKQIFPINDDLKLQIRYWKDRRNDCAHFKNNEIENHHTEAFWSFIKSNTPKITVEGGMETLLNKFNEHFDETKTPPNSDFTNLIKEIENSVRLNDLNDFFDKLRKIIDGRTWRNFNSETLNVYSKILDLSDIRTQENLILFFKQKDRDLIFLNSFPDKVGRLNYLKSEIRNLWKDRIFKDTLNINPYNIYSGLLRNNLIPNDEIEEANREMFNHFNQKTYNRLPEIKDIEILKNNYFFDVIYNISILEKDLYGFMWVNEKCDLIILFMKNYTINLEIVISVFKMVKSDKPSQWLIKELMITFIQYPKIKERFIKIAKSNNLSIPNSFN